jgi:[methyl-Co(III) methanol-specific corrinoid protein]:coenzyme M methyltransferase
MLRLAQDTVLTGCVNNPDTLYMGNTADVFSQTQMILDSGIKLVSPECAIPLTVKNENLRAITNCAAQYKLKPTTSP